MYSFNNNQDMRTNKKTGRLLLLILFILPAFAGKSQNVNSSNKKGPLGTQVNTRTGNMFIHRNDIYIPGRGFDLNVSFYYNSYNYANNTGFGNGWDVGYAARYKMDTANNLIIVWGDGREDIYSPVAGGGFQSPQGFFTTLTQYQPGKYLLKERDGTGFYFDNSSNKKMTKLSEPNGNNLSFNYTDSLITSIVNTAGQTISFNYNNGLLASVVDAVASPTRTFTYSYDINRNLTKVVDPLGGAFNYSYLLNGPMKSISDRNNNLVDIIYYNDFSTSEVIGCNKRISFSYDGTSKTTTVTDYVASGNQVTTYKYKAFGDKIWLSSLTGNCCGFNKSFEFDNAGNKIKETEADGGELKFTYDAMGNVLSMTDPENHISTYTYSATFNDITSYTDPNGNVTTLTYDTKGNLTQIAEPGNIVYSATYNSNGDIATCTDPRGNVYTYTFDAYGNPASVSGPNGLHSTLVHDARGNALSLTDANGHTSAAEFDILNRLKKITDPLNGVSKMTYDAEDNLVGMSNKNNESMAVSYDASNRMVKSVFPHAKQFNLNYDAMDNITTITDPIGSKTNYTYDNRNRLTTIKDAVGNISSYEYGATNNVTGIAFPNGQRVAYQYDIAHRLQSISDPTGNLMSMLYDANDNIKSFTNGAGAKTDVEYDNQDRITKVTDALGYFSTINYDKSNNISSIVDRNGRTTSFVYDSLNHLKTVTDNIGNVTTQTYDAKGNLLQTKDQNNHITTYAYDNLDKVTTITYPDGKYMQFGYDAKENITSKRMPNGTTITFQYDSLNRLTGKTLPDGNVYSFSYDAGNRLIAATNNSGTIALAYDALNRVTSETFDGRTVRYNYNTSGRTQTIIYPDSTVLVKTFDARNRLINVTKNNTNIASYQYNITNQMTSKTFGNGVTTSIQYDFANRLSSITTASGIIQNEQFTYDKKRNKNSITRTNATNQSEEFSYDNTYKLTGYKRGIIGGSPVVQNTYVYDALGNRTSANLNGVSTTYTSNNLNQIITSNNGSQNINFTYDNNGNLTYDGHYFKTYDAEGRLVKDSAAPSNVIAYHYDAFGRMSSKNNNTGVFKFTYSRLSPIEERDGISNNILSKNFFAKFLVPIAKEKSGNNYFYHQNEMYSVEAITNSAGNVVESYRYDVYGKPTIYDASGNPTNSSTIGNKFLFTGQEYDSATASYRFFYRNYSPETGNFNQRDPLHYKDGMGLYQYVGNNPANGVDMLGLIRSDEYYPEEHDGNENGSGNGGSAEPGPGSSSGGGLAAAGEATLDIGGNYVSNVTSITAGLTESTFSKIVNHSSIQLILMPINLINTIRGINDLSKYDPCMTEGQRADLQIGTFNNAWFTLTGMATWGTFTKAAWGARGTGVISATRSGFTAANGLFNTAKLAGRGFVVIGGAMAIYGLSNMAWKHFTGETFTETGWNAEIPGYTNLIRNLNSGMEGNRYFGADDHDIDWNTWNQNFSQKISFDEYEKIQKKLKERQEYARTHPRPAPRRIPDCPHNDPVGTQKPNPNGPGTPGHTTIDQSGDPNEMVGTEGVPSKHWVSVNDRLPYTVYYENELAASAPAKFVRITSPIEPKEDPATFQLGSFGFNTQTFMVAAGTASYYARLDCRDSLGLYVDVTAGYDQISNVAFWEFQSIDPLTLLPPTAPNKGFLLLQDSAHQLFGHAFVNFSIKPVATAVTLDTIGAKAKIVFDLNDTIPTNVYKNTIDAYAPVSHINQNIVFVDTTTVKISWHGQDDLNGVGVLNYSLYVSINGRPFALYKKDIADTSINFKVLRDTTYCFFTSAYDSVKNMEPLKNNCELSVLVHNTGPLPLTWLYFNGAKKDKHVQLKWATGNEINTKNFVIERSYTGNSWTAIGTVNAAGNSNGSHDYQYLDSNALTLPVNVLYYRLRQVDKDGKFAYSIVVTIRLEQTISDPIITAFPNPFSQTITLQVIPASLVDKTNSVDLYTIQGKLLYHKTIDRQGNTTTLLNDLPFLPAGVYILKTLVNETPYSFKISKQ